MAFLSFLGCVWLLNKKGISSARWRWWEGGEGVQVLFSLKNKGKFVISDVLKTLQGCRQAGQLRGKD